MHDTPGRVPAVVARMADGTLIYVSRKTGGWLKEDVSVYLIDTDGCTKAATVSDQPNFFPNGAISIETNIGKLWIPSEHGRVSAYWEDKAGRQSVDQLELSQFSIVDDYPVIVVRQLESAST